MKTRLPAICIALLLPVFLFKLQAQKTAQLFSPDKKNEWYSYLQKTGKNNDSLKVFQFEGETIHVSGEDFGYIITEKTYGDFRLTLDFKWGEKKYPPRENQKRDGGVLYFCQTYTGDRVWPLSLEFQVQEGDCGDFWMTGGSQIIHHDTLTTPAPWMRAGKFKDAEKPHGEWNNIEISVRKGKIIHKINGVVVNTGSNPSISRGRILLQSEGAELYYRNIKIEEY
jgi:Domain of Unknown Function (DUF1080)